MRKELTYDRNIVAQEYYWDCGPATAQIMLSIRGRYVDENTLIREIGTTVNGTDFVGLVENVLDVRLPDAGYTTVYLPNDPISAAQKKTLWDNIVHSIDNGYGVVCNVDAPAGNHPIGVMGSETPNYGWDEILHYLGVTGYSDEHPGGAVLFGDPGFLPNVYWVSFDQLATLIPPKGYAYAAADAGFLNLLSPADQNIVRQGFAQLGPAKW